MEENQNMSLIYSIPPSFKYFWRTLYNSRDIISIEDIISFLVLIKLIDRDRIIILEGQQSEGLIVKGRLSRKIMGKQRWVKIQIKI